MRKGKLINTGVGCEDNDDDGDSAGDVLAVSARSRIGTSARSAVRKDVFKG